MPVAKTSGLDEWEDSVFAQADHFRLIRFHDDNSQDRAEVKTLAQAMRLARDELNADRRVLVYAVAASGRFFCVAPGRWDHFAEVTLARARHRSAKVSHRVKRATDKIGARADGLCDRPIADNAQQLRVLTLRHKSYTNFPSGRPSRIRRKSRQVLWDISRVSSQHRS